jgi:adenylylsulfate kinase
MGDEGFTIWMTGLSGSGKSTLGRLISERLKSIGKHVELLDSGRLRRQINRDLGFSRKEIEANLLRIGYECGILNRNGVIAIVAAVSPYRDVRDRLRENIGRFFEVYCRCSMETLSKRDVEGLFEKAQSGEIDNVAGVNAPYEEPLKPEVLCNTDQEDAEACADKILKTLEILGFIDPLESARYSPEEEEIIKERLRDLGYI